MDGRVKVRGNEDCVDRQFEWYNLEAFRCSETSVCVCVCVRVCVYVCVFVVCVCVYTCVLQVRVLLPTKRKSNQRHCDIIPVRHLILAHYPRCDLPI